MQNRSGQRHVGRRSLEEREDRAVGRVHARPAAGPLRELRIAGVEGRALVHVPRLHVHPVDDADLVAILEVRADARQRHARLDAVAAQHVGGADARQHEELRRIEGAARENDLARRVQRAPLAGLAARRRVRAVEPFALEKLHADRAAGPRRAAPWWPAR